MKRKNTVGLWLGAVILTLCLTAGAGFSQVSPTDELLEIVRTGWNKEITKTQLLIDQGADVNAKNKYGDTPLIRASRNGNVEIVNLLKRAGAKS